MPHRKTHKRSTRKNRSSAKRGGGKNNFSKNKQTRALNRYRKNQTGMSLKKLAKTAAIGALALGGPYAAYKGYESTTTPKTTIPSYNIAEVNYTNRKPYPSLLPASSPTCKTYRKWVTQLDTINNTKEFKYTPLNESRISKMVLCDTPESISRNLELASRVMENVRAKMYDPNDPSTRYIVTEPLYRDYQTLQNTLDYYKYN